MTPEARSVNLIKAVTRTLKTFDCAHCTRVSLEITATGKMIWTSHGHPNATTLNDLFNFSLTVVNKQTLQEWKRQIDEVLREAA